MGLDTTHGCYNGSYSAFNQWRSRVCQEIGLGDIYTYEGFGGSKRWPPVSSEPLVSLLNHWDGDGILKWQECDAMADRLDSIVNNMGQFKEVTEQWIEGLRLAYESQENVEFN